MVAGAAARDRSQEVGRGAFHPESGQAGVRIPAAVAEFDGQRQALMKAELARILEVEAISPDVYEIVTKSL